MICIPLNLFIQMLQKKHTLQKFWKVGTKILKKMILRKFGVFVPIHFLQPMFFVNFEGLVVSSTK